jgi:hypothetical protein
MKAFLKWFAIGLVIIMIASLVLMAIDQLLPEGWKLEAQWFVFLAGAVLSATWTFMPGLRVQFAVLKTETKVLINLILMVLLAGLMMLFTCVGWSPIAGVICTVAGAKALGVLVFMAIVGNQLTYVASPQPDDVKDAKFNRIISG